MEPRRSFAGSSTARAANADRGPTSCGPLSKADKHKFDYAKALAAALDDERCEAADESPREDSSELYQPFARCLAPAGNQLKLERFPYAELTPKIHYVRVCDQHAADEGPLRHWLRPVWPVLGEAAKHCPCGRWQDRFEVIS